MFARFMARLAGVALAVTACPSYALAADNILTIGLIAPTSVEQTLQSWKPLADGLARELRMPVKVVASKNYSEIASALIDGRVQLAWLNNRLAIDAVDMDQAQVFAQMVRLDGRSGYKSVLLARKDGVIQSITDILGKPGT
ncbi:PhnD/SsuA/transferrin family substrate-binding protein [Polaromonas sp.]|uniref:PhnD/SsuA/transferrin family substrate-binding protein n=1 Tax=Polaromonas sp. TaxID=1869339 RepID=UPI00286BD9DB|nr:PhnD/SsuA/transferrin family substrate-binding protein [Polaromonas sp.]